VARSRGNLLVHVDVQTPTRLDAEQEKLLRELAVLRGEDRPSAAAAGETPGGLFARVRNPFK
jgi:molecular chaperone DnaJ